MPFSIRPHRRFPVLCPVTYYAGLSEGQGTLWNVSLNGWRMSGDLPLRVGQSFPMSVALPNKENVFVAAGIVRWVRGDDYGVETVVADDATLNQVARFIKQQTLTQRYGGDYALNTAPMDGRYQSARPSIGFCPSEPDSE